MVVKNVKCKENYKENYKESFKENERHNGNAGNKYEQSVLKRKKENYLERRPMRVPGIVWSLEDGGAVTLHLKNRGVFHRAAQLFFHRPQISHVRLDAPGSLVWTLSDGSLSLLQLGEAVREKFGASAEPLYERLALFVHTLEGCRLIRWRKD